ncbi:uncharacterized protein LOC130614197 [Hydractinia symbiolongicarpus]|uniref:uncharacterized protein LOC130614197 n=1 Tax=Hydractinia symbiolongicarpus TaxID=13093 RepID=UPI00255152FE|nr:uncharacterized protein LOC130614197 [Hydractinia symbiolongicarpus]
MGRTCYIAYITLLWITPCVAYITRLPCKRHANFTVMKPDIRYAGAVFETHADVIARDCALLCLSRDACAYFNHKMDNTSCELLTINSGTEQSASGWKFYSTSYGTPNRGPVCRSLAPCHFSSACEDICESPGYKCISGQFQGMIGTVSVAPAPLSSSHDAGTLTDGNSGTFPHTVSRVDAFISLDIGMEKLVRFVTIKIYSSGANQQISIGNTNANTGNTMCSLLPPYGEVEILVECSDLLSGRYVVIHNTPGAGAQYVHVRSMHAHVDV